jgi:dimethylglycine dehydrogenase
VRERVGLMDLSTFAKFDVRGRDAHSFLERCCANKIPAKDGGVALAHLLNPEGFIESEVTITRLAADHFYVLSAAVAELHDLDQFAWRKLADEDVAILDVTDDFGTLVLAGPRSRDALAACTAARLDNEAFRWLSARTAEVAGVAGVRLLRMNYVGELGWELHCPMAETPEVFEALMAAGEPYGIRLFGTYAMNSLRMEKAYRAWGSELTAEVDMFEAAMERFIRFDKGDFIGRAASLSKQQRGPRMRLVYCALDATDSDCMGNEPVYAGDRLVGVTTSGAFGHALGKSLAFAYVDPDLSAPGTEFEIALFAERRKAVVLPAAAWDPDNARARA